MPKVRPGMPKPPKGFDKALPVLNGFDANMKAALAESNDGKRKVEATWEVARVNRERTRAVFKLWQNGDIERQVLDYCCTVGFVDGSLVRLWALPGYDGACCTECVQPRNHSFGGACICRVPAKDRGDDPVRCSHCGCNGCASGDRKQNDESEG